MKRRKWSNDPRLMCSCGVDLGDTAMTEDMAESDLIAISVGPDGTARVHHSDHPPGPPGPDGGAAIRLRDGFPS